MESASGGDEQSDTVKKLPTIDKVASNGNPVKNVDGAATMTFDSEAAVITMNYGNNVDCLDSDESSPSDIENNEEEEEDQKESERKCSRSDANEHESDTSVEKNPKDEVVNENRNTENNGTENDVRTEEVTEEIKHHEDDEGYSNQLAKMRSERFNPFNKVPFLEENHFDSDNAAKMMSSVRVSRKSSGCSPGSFLESGIVLDSDHDPGHSSKSSETSDTMTESSLPSSFTDFEGELINAELGLTEDHFSHPEGYFGFTKIEELQLAIENCKEMAKEAPEHSEKKKELIKKLVQLRMKLQELKEGPEEEEPDTKVTLGHRFRKKNSKTAKHHCEKCTGLIWGMIQPWYRCKGCGYTCHSKCMNSITRACLSVKLATASFLMSICPEAGLASQSFRCSECKNQISSKGAYGEARQCDYNGLYYCEECHWNDTEIIPARVVHNWDFEPRKVSRISRQFLRLMAKKAVIKIQDVNPMLFNYVEELSQIRKIREDILMMKAYFLSCRNALENRILLRLKDRQHFVDNSDMYSMQDLRDTYDGVILPELFEIHSDFAKHIQEDCQLCHAKGFICELCDNEEILFPFDTLASICPKCNAVYHRVCFSRNNGECPKCARFAGRNMETQ